MKDPRGAATLDGDGQRAQQAWRCPRVCEPSDEPLPLAQRTAIDNVHRLFGVDTEAGDPPECSTCPGYYARLPEAFEVARLLPWFRKGQLHLREPNPSGALVDAIDLVEQALSLRESDELRRLRERDESPPKR